MFIPYNPSLSQSSKTQRFHERQARIRRKNSDDNDSDSDSDSDDKRKIRKSSNIPYANTEGFRVTSYTNRKSAIPEAFIIPPGQPFSGRMSGGSGRRDIFGSRTYGSGYPDDASRVGSRGTLGRDLPFIFWPIVWPISKKGPGFDYLAADGEYGDPTNTTRLGGPMMVAKFTLIVPTTPISTSFRVLSDNITVAYLMDAIMSNCSSNDELTMEPISPFTGSPASAPSAESVVQYYRASSIGLALEGYNNTSIHSPVSAVFDAAMPELDGQSADMLSCLNHTIGRAAPLVTSVNKENIRKERPAASPATTVVAVICSLFGFCIVLGAMMRCISIKRRRRAMPTRF